MRKFQKISGMSMHARFFSPPSWFLIFFIVSSVNNLFGGGKINKAGKSDFEPGVVKSGKIRSTKACENLGQKKSGC